MMAISPRTRLIATLVVAGVGLALFFGDEYRDIGFPLGWIGTVLFVAAVWYCVSLVHQVPHSDDEAVIAPGEWQAWVGVAFVGAVIAAAVLKADVFQLPVPIGHNPDASAAGRSIGTLFVAWYVLSYVLKQRWAGTVERDERDARIARVAGGWAHCTSVVAIIAIAVLLGFSDTERLREFSYPFIAHMLMLALLAGLWIEQVGAALLYWRDRRGA
ncbi:MAG TPA: hypothetical protein VFK18_01620 [Luteimonas sp.]|nr:hypothetical protein [Luteimonas sp.]